MRVRLTKCSARAFLACLLWTFFSVDLELLAAATSSILTFGDNLLLGLSLAFFGGVCAISSAADPMFSSIVAGLFTDSSSPFCKKKKILIFSSFSSSCGRHPVHFLFLSTAAFLCPRHDLFARSTFSSAVIGSPNFSIARHHCATLILRSPPCNAHVALVEFKTSRSKSFESRVTTLWPPLRW